MQKFTLTFLVCLLSLPLILKAQDNARLVIDPHGHASMIRELKIFDQGKRLMTVSDDKTLRIWDTQNGELLRTERGHIGDGSEGKLYAIALSPDERYLAVGGWLSADGDKEWGRIRLLDFEHNTILDNMVGHEDVVNCLAFSPDGRYLASGSADEQIRIWDVSQRPTKLVGVLQGHEESVQQIAFLSQDKLVSVSYDHTGIIWDWKSNRISKKLEAHTDRVSGVACSPDGKYIVTGGYDNTIYLWDNKGKMVKKLYEAEDPIYTMAFSESGKYLVAHGTRYTKGLVFSMPNGSLINEFAEHNYTVVSSDFYGDDMVVTAGGNNNDIFIWRPKTGEILNHMVGQGVVKRTVGLGFENGLVGYGSTWGGVNGKGPLEMSFDFNELRLNAQQPNQGDYVKAITSFRGMSMQSPDDHSLTVNNGPTIKIDRPTDGWVKSNTFTQSGDIIIGSNFSLKAFDQQGELQKKFIGHTGVIWGVAVSPDGRYLASASGDQTVKIWSLVEPGEVRSVAETYTHESWEKIWENQGWTDIAKIKSKKAWLEIIAKLNSVDYGSDAKTLQEYYNNYIVNSVETIKPLITLFVGTDQEWVCWTPQGYYAASAGGERFVGWHIDQGINKMGDFYPVSAFRKKYYRPELIKAVFEEASFEKALARFNQGTEEKIEKNETILSNLPPQFEWINPAPTTVNTPEQTYKVKARVYSDVEIQNVKLLVNGRSLATARGLKVVSGDSPNEKNVEIEITLNSPETTLSIFASNENSSSVSEERLIRWAPLQGNNSNDRGGDSDELEFDMLDEMLKPSLYVVSVGVSEFQNSDYNLTYADDDAIEISKILKTQNQKLYKEVHVKELTNSNAKRADILDAFYWLEENATHKDMVMIFIASHGFNEKGQFYILPHDGNHERLRTTGVDWADFQDVLGNLPSKVVLYLDACHSGQLGSSLMASRDIEIDNIEAIREITSPEHGVVVMSASTGKEKSLESAEWQHGAFTLALIRGLQDKKADLDKDGIIYLRELDFFVADEVKNITKGKQHPTTQKPSTISRLPLIQAK